MTLPNANFAVPPVHDRANLRSGTEKKNVFDAKTDQKNDQNRNSQWIPQALIKNQHRIYFQSSLLLLISESPWHKVERRCWTTWTIIENMQILFRSTCRSTFVLRQDVAWYWKVCQLWWGLPQFFDFRIYIIVKNCRLSRAVEWKLVSKQTIQLFETVAQSAQGFFVMSEVQPNVTGIDNCCVYQSFCIYRTEFAKPSWTRQLLQLHGLFWNLV